jgi:hypothetical protein
LTWLNGAAAGVAYRESIKFLETAMKAFTASSALVALLLMVPAWTAAQPAKGAEGAQQAAPVPGPQGPGPRPGMGPRYGPDYTPGWSMMSREERDAHRQRMAQARTAEQCRLERDTHRQLMERRALERGLKPMPAPRRDACAGLRN